MARSVLGVAGVVAASLIAPAAGAQDPDDGLRFRSAWSFQIDPAAGVIRGSVRLDLTNQQAPAAGYYSYLPRVGVPVLTGATDVRAVREPSGQELDVRLEPTALAEVSMAVVDLQPDLSYRDNAVVRVDFLLPDQPPRTRTLTRVNAAFAALIPLIVGDPGLVDLEIVVPEGFEVEFAGDPDLEVERRDGEVVYRASGIADPRGFDASLVVRDDDGLTTRRARAGEHRVTIRSWPNDPAWADFVTAQVTDGIPALERLIGRPLPVDGLVITETVGPYLYGYAGWYSHADQEIEVGEDLDRGVVLHEISHAWFNGTWFSERWIGEAFAEEYSSRAQAELGEPLGTPAAVRPDDPGRMRLADWTDPILLDEVSESQELYGYNASWAVLRTVTDEIGVDGMARVIASIDDRTIAYTGDPEPEASTGRLTGWRRLLDLLQNVGGSREAEQNFADLVARDADVASFADRAAARAAYDELTAAGDGWTAPFVVRRDLSQWSFAAATDGMAEALEVLEARGGVAQVLAGADTDDPIELSGMEAAYESARTQQALAAVTPGWRRAAEELAEAAEAATDPGGPIAVIGRIGGGAGDELDRAITAFESGDLDATDSAIAAVHRAVDRSERNGVLRLLALAPVALLVVGVTRIARRRRPDADPPSTPDVDDARDELAAER